MAVPALVQIAKADSICEICPALGGSIASWSVGQQDMLRRSGAADLASNDPLAAASFPLVPYSNRIGYARFVWDDHDVQLTPNFLPEPHAIHGTGWTNIWDVTEISAARCVLTYRHAADDHWPWSFAATQIFEVEHDALTLTLQATNLAVTAAPLAFGHHPYFDQAGARLQFDAAAVLMSGDDALPTTIAEPSGLYDFAMGADVVGRNIDHCYAGWNGRARIDWAGRPLALEIASDMAAAVVYIPGGGQAFCFEPVPHINNALNRSDAQPAMPIVDPGATFTATICLSTVESRSIK